MLDIYPNSALSSSANNNNSNLNDSDSDNNNNSLHEHKVHLNDNSSTVGNAFSICAEVVAQSGGFAPDRSLTYVPLVDKIGHYTDPVPFFSVEFFPPRTDKGAASLVRLLDRYAEGRPHFADITWHVAGQPWLEKPTSSVTVAGIALNYCCLDTMLHLTCIGQTADDMRVHLKRAKRLGIRNILALRGDKNVSSDSTFDFHYATDLVRFIRAEYGRYFTIVVAGYPIPHVESDSAESDLRHLKDKVDAGADVIITQLFFEAHDFVAFVRRCRAIGITVPIIPGIISLNTYQSIQRLSTLSGVPLPDRMVRSLESIKDNDEAVQNFGVYYLVELCRELIDSKLTPGLHFYTLNQDTMISVVKQLGLWRKTSVLRSLPWPLATNHRRIHERTRPVFWLNRSKSYISRTHHWLEYPTTSVQWCGKFAAQISDSLTNDYHAFLEVMNSRAELDAFLVTDTTDDESILANVCQLFRSFYAKYCTATVNDHFDTTSVNSTHVEGSVTTANTTITKSISSIPWVQQGNSHYLESAFLRYGQFITNGVLLVNYLPGFGCEIDDDCGIGLNGSNGFDHCSNHINNDAKTIKDTGDRFVKQLEYLECLLDPTHLDRLRAVLGEFGDRVQFCIANRDGSIRHTNWASQPIALRWGVDSPRYQTSVCSVVADLVSFDKWRAECFGLLDGWLRHYDAQSGPYRVLHRIQTDFVLVSLIGNQFVSVTDDRDHRKPATSAIQHVFNQLFATPSL